MKRGHTLMTENDPLTDPTRNKGHDLVVSDVLLG